MAKMTIFEAALQVLRESDGGPLHFREITKRAIDSGYTKLSGQTPDASFGAALYAHIKRAKASGQEPTIRQIGSGQFALSKKTEIGALKLIKESNAKVRSELFDRIRELHPRTFENLVGALLSSIGFENVVVTKYSGDGGLDIEAELTVGGVTNVKTAVQVKRWKNNVSGKIVRELRGGLKTDQRGLIITTSSFTRDSKKEAEAESKTPISLINGEQLLNLLIQYEIGISKKPISYLELDLEQLEDFEAGSDISSSGQSLGLWPLPGGREKLVESTLKMLRDIAQTEPTNNQMIDWMRATFPKAKSEKTIKGYIRVLKTLNLIIFDGEEIKITEDGSKALTKDPKEIILNQLRACVAGVDQYLDALKERAMTLEESHEFFKKELSVDWETNYQTKMRLLWLENVGAIIKEGGTYVLV
ncbi:MAG TPA: restriction endonuclease [Candidatus Bathyarchaeia archaeon]|nr:restriction endonuclease [Candidatus Bathyarchaeia archaeon]